MEKSCGTITIKDNKVLMVFQNIGHYSFPKGHVENNETEYETALRETYEETGVKVRIIDNSPRYSMSYLVRGNMKEVVLFLAKVVDESNLKPQEGEIKRVFWEDIDKIRDILTYDNAKELWDKVLEDINNGGKLYEKM